MEAVKFTIDIRETQVLSDTIYIRAGLCSLCDLFSQASERANGLSPSLEDNYPSAFIKDNFSILIAS